ncbi:hypothetical protein [Aridibaculum aurantiacum]|uniref:hypothetical protein n=1 Tax=Aridibaculum aurantiacum TaxID=2810307 RepID=UPI001A970151|nr:hypothetical protein [Aridibaculum aurantiacum]
MKITMFLVAAFLATVKKPLGSVIFGNIIIKTVFPLDYETFLPGPIPGSLVQPLCAGETNTRHRTYEEHTTAQVIAAKLIG